jgi:hypothetical protein
MPFKKSSGLKRKLKNGFVILDEWTSIIISKGLLKIKCKHNY